MESVLLLWEYNEQSSRVVVTVVTCFGDVETVVEIISRVVTVLSWWDMKNPPRVKLHTTHTHVEMY